MSDKKKKAAAIAGALFYLKSMQAYEAVLPVEAPPVETVQHPGPVFGTSIWGLSGRQAQMQTRTLLQLKAFRSL